jgi:hypothetical protein
MRIVLLILMAWGSEAGIDSLTTTPPTILERLRAAILEEL